MSSPRNSILLPSVTAGNINNNNGINNSNNNNNSDLGGNSPRGTSSTINANLHSATRFIPPVAPHSQPPPYPAGSRLHVLPPTPSPSPPLSPTSPVSSSSSLTSSLSYSPSAATTTITTTTSTTLSVKEKRRGFHCGSIHNLIFESSSSSSSSFFHAESSTSSSVEKAGKSIITIGSGADCVSRDNVNVKGGCNGNKLISDGREVRKTLLIKLIVGGKALHDVRARFRCAQLI